MRLAAADRRTRPARPRPRVLATVVVMALCTLMASACSSSDSDAGPTATVGTAPPTDPTTTTAATTTTVALTPEEEVEAAYLAASDGLADAARTADVDETALSATRTGPALETAIEQLKGLSEAGLVVEYAGDKAPQPEIRSVEITGSTEAVVTYCIVDDARQVDDSTGAVVDDRVQSRLNEASMRRADDRWKLQNQENLELWADGKGCDR